MIEGCSGQGVMRSFGVLERMIARLRLRYALVSVFLELVCGANVSGRWRYRVPEVGF